MWLCDYLVLSCNGMKKVMNIFLLLQFQVFPWLSLTGLSQGSAYSDLVLYRLPLSIFYLKQLCAA